MKYDKNFVEHDELDNRDFQDLSLTAIGAEIQRQSHLVAIEARKLSAVGLDRVADQLDVLQSNIYRLAARIYPLYIEDLDNQIGHNAAMLGGLVKLALSKDITDKPGYKNGEPISTGTTHD
jgi:hypothetical protein